MKKIIGILSLLILAACSANKFDVQLIYDSPASPDQAMTFAVVDFNPAQKFLKDYIPEKESGKSIITKWDELFNGLPANDYFLLNNGDSVSYSKVGGIFIPLSQNWWIISKAFLIDGRPFCYIVPLDIKKGSKISCKADQSHLVSLAELRD